ncbi:hypothetical protein [Lampropedia aestuarii]|uniref:hypothetical protein n=1 Tax=Lampropedia aestuarii TaxID=2562762 RepID=UPI00246975FC|nr:hypothetical protein [Lampropedia aestuarii]MDH5858025.1 hypothetical protein [Lampropedia aestuarii]
MTHPHATQHAAALADHFVSVILEGDPELLVSNLDELDEEEVRDVAKRLAIFRLALIEELAAQPHAQDEDEDEDCDEA